MLANFISWSKRSGEHTHLAQVRVVFAASTEAENVEQIVEQTWNRTP